MTDGGTRSAAAPPRRPAPRWTAYLFLVIPPLCWAGNFVVGRAVEGEIPPMALTFWRWVVAGAVLLPFAAGDTWRARAAIRRHAGLIAALAVTGVFCFQYFVYLGLQTTTAVNGALIVATIPLAIPVFGYLLDRARLARRQALGIAVSLLGVGVVILRGDPLAAADLALTPGDLWIFLAVPMWAVYSVLVRRRPADVPPLALLLATILFGFPILLPAYLIELGSGAAFTPTPWTLLAIGYVGIFASVLGFVFWNRGVARIGAAKTGLFIHLMPVFAALLAVIFLGERLQPFHAPGILLVAAGLYLSSTAKSG